MSSLPRLVVFAPLVLAACASGGAPEAAAPAPVVADLPAWDPSGPAWAVTIEGRGEAAARARAAGEQARRAAPLGEEGTVSVSATQDGTERAQACGRDFTESRARARASLRSGTDSAGGAYQTAEITMSARAGSWREKGTLTCGRRRASEAEASTRVELLLVVKATGDPGVTDQLLVRVTGQPASRLGLALADTAGTVVPLAEAGEGFRAEVPAGTWVLTGTLQGSVAGVAGEGERDLSRRATVQVQGLRDALAVVGGTPDGQRRLLEVPLESSVLTAGLSAGLTGGADAWRPCPDKTACDGRGEDLLVTGATATPSGGGVRVVALVTGRGDRVDSLAWMGRVAADAEGVRLTDLVPAGSTLDRRTTAALQPVVAARLEEPVLPVAAPVQAAANGMAPLRWAGTCVPAVGRPAFEGVRDPAGGSAVRLVYSLGLGTPAACPAGGPGR